MFSTQTKQKECLSKFKQAVCKCKQAVCKCRKKLIRSKKEKLQLQHSKAWAKIENVIATQNYIDYPWIYTAYVLTENDCQMLGDWCIIITLHCQMISRNLSVAEIDKITHYWLGSKGIERFL